MIDIKNGWTWCVKQLEQMIGENTQLPAVAVADATDEASAVTQLNALLAALRTAGVISTE